MVERVTEFLGHFCQCDRKDGDRFWVTRGLFLLQSFFMALYPTWGIYCIVKSGIHFWPPAIHAANDAGNHPPPRQDGLGLKVL